MLHFAPEEFAARHARVKDEMQARGLDGMLIFAPESQYWLTGYDTFGYCFFQCLILGGAEPVLLTRSADLRQAQLTSNITDIRVWIDGADANPAWDLAALLDDLGLTNKTLGIERDTHGLTAFNGDRVNASLDGHITLTDASDLFSNLRLVKSPAEIAYTRRAAELADAALDAGLPLIHAGQDEAQILTVLQGAIFAGGGDYPANEIIIGSGDNALLCRYQAGRLILKPQDQLTLEWAGTYRHYHAAMMRTAVIGTPSDHQHKLQAAGEAALLACEAALKPGDPMGHVFDAHVTSLQKSGLGHARLNACGYSLGARFSPSWMEREMFFENAATIMQPGMVFFLHMILMDDETGKANCLGRTSLVTQNGSEPLSKQPLDLIVG